MVVLGSSSLWLRLLRAVECWLAVVSKDDADTPSLRGAILGAEGESDFTAGPVAPENKSLGLSASICNFQRATQEQGSVSAQLEEIWGFPQCCQTVIHLRLCSAFRFTPTLPLALQRASRPTDEVPSTHKAE